jgi:stage III sporulation protein AH
LEVVLKKIKKNQLIITAVAIMLAVAGYINYTGNLSDIISVKETSNTVNPTSNPTDEETGDILSNDAEPDVNSLEEPGSVVLTSGNSVASGIISEAKLNREQIRAKNKETLLEIINNDAMTDSAKAAAVTQLSDITENSEKEIAAELLLEAKGFTDVVVSMLDGNVDVVVNLTELTDTQKAQIEDIVKRKTGVTADKITINVCNNLNN